MNSVLITYCKSCHFNCDTKYKEIEKIINLLDENNIDAEFNTLFGNCEGKCEWYVKIKKELILKENEIKKLSNKEIIELIIYF